MPPEAAEQLRVWMRELAREAVAEALAEARGHVTSEFVSTAEAATIAGVGVPTVQRWIREQRLSACGAGRKRRIRRVDLDRLMQSSERRSPTSKAAMPPSPDDVLVSMGYQ